MHSPCIYILDCQNFGISQNGDANFFLNEIYPQKYRLLEVVKQKCKQFPNVFGKNLIFVNSFLINIMRPFTKLISTLKASLVMIPYLCNVLLAPMPPHPSKI